MADFLELVKHRHSCRSYRPDPVPDEMILRCLEASCLAPSACNSQPWYFIAVRNSELKARLAQGAFSGIYAMNAFAKQAPVLVVAVRQASTYAARMGGILRGVEYSLIDLGIACDHFTLAAAEQGLATCWLGWFDARAVKRCLDLPVKAKVDVILSVGFPQGGERIEKKRKSLSEISELR